MHTLAPAQSAPTIAARVDLALDLDLPALLDEDAREHGARGGGNSNSRYEKF